MEIIFGYLVEALNYMLTMLGKNPIDTEDFGAWIKKLINIGNDPEVKPTEK